MTRHISPLRINVIGTTGAGKSTLARRLARELGISDIELDELYWKPNWVGTPPEEFIEKVRHATSSSDSWVVHGNYTRTRPVIWSNATHIVWLDYPPPFIFARLLNRTITRLITREPMWTSQNRESFRLSFMSKESILVWFFKTYKKNRTLVPEMLKMAEYRHIKLIRLTSPREVEGLTARILEAGSRDEEAALA